MERLSRRDFIKLGAVAGSWLALGGTPAPILRASGKRETAEKIIVLGIDGMDPDLATIWMDQGKLPNFQRLRSEGSFQRLRTSVPPQSPVAWSNFITGTDPGGHAIFDFIHRDPKNYLPTFSASLVEEPKRTLKLGGLILPLSAGEISNLRKGRAFWQVLEDHDIPATIFKIPSNYPPVPTGQRTISGLGTPDVTGTHGEFNYYTTQFLELKDDIGGGEIHEVQVSGNKVEAQLPGPRNTFKKERPKSFIDFKVFLDPEHPAVKIVIQDQEFLLKEGEWSDWKRVRFTLLPTQTVSGICKFYVRQVRPDFKLYVSPINIDPRASVLPISTPPEYAEELEKEFGPFYTKGLPADTKALDHGVLDEGEFLEQDEFVLRERMEMFDYELARFDSGLLFYYVSSSDQRQHMFWRLADKQHPFYDPKLASKFGRTIESTYIEMDRMLAKTMDRMDDRTTLIVMSDHGFASFRRSFNLNSWLKENGYLSLRDPKRQDKDDFFLNTDWSGTRAYAYGLNSIFINQVGREREGVVRPGAQTEAIAREIAAALEQVTDPQSGEKVISKAYVAKDTYHGGFVEEAPEIVVGYNRGYRASWSTPLGGIPKELLVDNTERWSGDHCMDPEVIPGVLFTNRKTKMEYPALYDVTATVLDLFGVERPKEMIGKPIIA